VTSTRCAEGWGKDRVYSSERLRSAMRGYFLSARGGELYQIAMVGVGAPKGRKILLERLEMGPLVVFISRDSK